MIPRASERIWIIVFWVLLLQCSPINPVLVQTAENDGESVRHAVEDAENLYHRIIDDSEFHHDPSSSRHKINVAHSNLDIALNAIDETGRFQDIAAIIDDPRHRVLSNDEHRPQHHTDGHLTRDRRELSKSQTPPTGTPPIGSTPQTVFPSASNKAGHASTRVSISMAPTSADGGDVRGHGSMADAAMENARKLHPGVKPPVVIDSLKASNLDQLISGGAPSPAMVHSKLNPSTSAQLEPGRTPTPTPGGSPKHPITVSHSSATTSDNHRQRYGDGAKVEQPEPSFILLDDSVYIAPVSHRNSSGHGTSRVLPPAGTDLTLDAVFGGRNFDEQIIFLNGPDLVDASAEQEMPSPMGKVPRAVAEPEEPLVLPLRPIVRDPAEQQLADGNVVLVYADQHETVRLNCEVDADITTGVWLKDGQIVHATDKKSRTADVRFVRESFGALTIANVMLEDDGVWQCEAENARGFFFNGRPIKLIVLDPPKEPYLLIDSRRLDAGNMFIPVKENSELTLACVSEGGNPKPTLTWEVLLSPGIDRHAQKLSTDVLELQEIRKDKDKEPYKINSGAVSEAKLAAVFRVHHQARILCIMEHPTLKVRQNASILLDVQYTPSFAITRTPGFGYPLREGIEVSLKCDVDSNPPSTPLWQKDDGDPPVPQTGDGFLNFSAIRREHSGWYKCTSRHLNFQYSSIGYYLSVRYEPVDVTSEPVEQDLSLSPASSSSSAAVPSSAVSGSPGSFPYANGAGSFPAGLVPGGSPIKGGSQMEVELGGSVTLQCPQGSLGCWSHLDSATARLKGLGSGSYAQTGQLSLKDVVYQDAGTYKCVGQSATTAAAAGNRKKLEVLQTVSIAVKGAPTVTARNATPIVLPGTALHLAVEFCSNPPANAARWLHGDRIYTPGNQYGTEVLAYGFTDLPTPHCKEARLTYAHMHEKVPRTFYFVVSSPGGVAEAVFRVNYTSRHRSHTAGGHSGAGTGPYSGGTFSVSGGVGASGGMANGNGGLGSGYKGTGSSINAVPGNGLDADDETLMEPEEIHFPIFGTSGVVFTKQLHWSLILPMVLLLRLLQSKVAL